MHPVLKETEAFEPATIAVRFSGSHISPEAAAALSRLHAYQTSDLNPQGTASFAVPQSTDIRQAAAALRGVRGIMTSGPIIYRHRLDVLTNDPQFDAGQIVETSPPAHTNQWDFFALQMPAAWATTVGSSAVKIAIIDTGYDMGNPDINTKVDAAIVFDCNNGQPDTNASIQDTDGHGTDVSGIAAADTNNNTDVAGVGWNTRLFEARVFPYKPNPGANTQDIAAAINWAVAAGAKVINLSLGSATPDNNYEEPAVAAAIKAGVVVVAASGNDGQNTVDYPAADPGVIAVGASAYYEVGYPNVTTPNTLAGGHEGVASYSNYGAGLSLVAPGADPSAAQTAPCGKPGQPVCPPIDFLQWIDNLDSLQGQFKETVGLFAGTSQASPHVAGAVALMLAKDPTLTPAQALSIVKSTADNIGSLREGAGRLNVLNALKATP